MSSVQVSYGTGTAPNNGASATGTVIGIPTRVQGASQGYSALATSVYITGLTLGTPYWFDLQGKTSAGGGGLNVGGIQAVATEQ